MSWTALTACRGRLVATVRYRVERHHDLKRPDEASWDGFLSGLPSEAFPDFELHPLTWKHFLRLARLIVYVLCLFILGYRSHERQTFSFVGLPSTVTQYWYHVFVTGIVLHKTWGMPILESIPNLLVLILMVWSLPDSDQ